MADPVVDPQTTLEGMEGHINELLDGYMPSEGADSKPEADPKPAEGQPEGEPKPGDAKPEGEGEAKPVEGADGQPPAAAEPPKQPDPAVKTYEYRGKQYTIEQMIELGVLEDALQTARQFPTVQTKYQQLLEQTRLGGAPAVQPAGQPEPPVATGPSADQILTAYTPVMHQSAEAGYIEKEAYEAFPRLVSALMFHRDLLYDVRKAVAGIMENTTQREGVNQKTMFLDYLGNLCNEVSGEGEHFAQIKDPDTRQKFWGYLATLNIPVNEVTKDFVKKQWVAFNSETVLEAAKSASAARQVEDKKTRRNAAGEGGGPRPAPGAKVEKTADNVLIESFLDGDKRFTTGG